MKKLISLLIFASLFTASRAQAAVSYEISVPSEGRLEDIEKDLEKYVHQAQKALDEKRYADAQILKRDDYQRILKKIGLSTQTGLTKALIVGGLPEDVNDYEFSEMNQETKNRLKEVVNGAMGGHYPRFIVLIKKISLLDLTAYIESLEESVRWSQRDLVFARYAAIDSFMIKIRPAQAAQAAQELILFDKDLLDAGSLIDLTDSFAAFDRLMNDLDHLHYRHANYFRKASEEYRQQFSARFDSRRKADYAKCVDKWSVLLGEVYFRSTETHLKGRYYFYDYNLNNAAYHYTSIYSQYRDGEEDIMCGFSLDARSHYDKCYVTQKKLARRLCQADQQGAKLKQLYKEHDGPYNYTKIGQLIQQIDLGE